MLKVMIETMMTESSDNDDDSDDDDAVFDARHSTDVSLI